MDVNSPSWVDTSLDLNAKPLLQRLDQAAALPATTPVEQRNEDLEEEIDRVRAENKKLTEMLTAMCENYSALRRQLMDYLNNNNVSISETPSGSRKRKSGNPRNNINDDDDDRNNNNLALVNIGVSESSTTEEDSTKKIPREDQSTIRAKISTVCVRTQVSDNTLVVKDGYQWRKYGQKVTRDNPCPRAYFKCSFAPSCPVKKKVQRSAEDQSMVVATYEGEHNHPPPSNMEPSSSSSSGRCITIGSAPLRTLDLTRTRSNIEPEAAKRASLDSPEVRQYLVKQMASSLTRDPNFTAALAAAISGKMFPGK